MNSSELRAVCKVLGSADFWGERGAQAPAQSGEANAAWDEAKRMVEACLKFVFLDHERFSTATEFRSRMEKLSEKLGRINECRRQLSRKRDEQTEVRRALASLARHGWIDSAQQEPDETEGQVLELMSLNVGRKLRFLLESAIALEEPAMALRVSSLWAFGNRRQSRRLAREHGFEVGQVRHWAGLLKDFVGAVSEGDGAAAEEHGGSASFSVIGFEDFANVDARLEEQLVADEESLARLNGALEESRLKLRGELVGLLIRRRLSPDVIGDAAMSPWGLEVQVLREALWRPLVPEEQIPEADTAVEVSAKLVASILSENGLALRSPGLSFLGGRLAGGNLDRSEFLSLRESKLQDFLKETVSELAGTPRFDSLPAVERDAADVRAEMDIARRTAMEIIKLRSFIKASLEVEVREVSEVVKRLKSSIVEGLRPSSAADKDVKELQAVVGSLRRDIARLGKNVQDEMSRAVRSEMIKDFLFVIDDLSRIMKHAKNGTTRGFHEGLEMVVSRLERAFTRYDIRRIKAVGEMFDQSVHDCAGVKKVAGCKDGVVLEEVLSGFTIGDKVLRPAKVIVCG